jgi:hypothetical protein
MGTSKLQGRKPNIDRLARRYISCAHPPPGARVLLLLLLLNGAAVLVSWGSTVAGTQIRCNRLRILRLGVKHTQ